MTKAGRAGGRPKKTPLTDALRKLVESKESLKIKPDDDNATQAAKHLLRLIASGKVSAFKEAADRIEGTSRRRSCTSVGSRKKATGRL